MHFNTVNKLLKEIGIAEQHLREVEDAAVNAQENAVLIAYSDVVDSITQLKDAIRLARTV